MSSEFMPTDIANGFISVIEKKNMPDELKSWAVDNIKNFNTLCYAKRKMLYDNILTKLVEEEEEEEEEQVEVNCICDKCFGEGTTWVSAERAKELKEMELMEECCPYGDKCNAEEEEEEEEEEK